MRCDVIEKGMGGAKLSKGSRSRAVKLICKFQYFIWIFGFYMAWFDNSVHFKLQKAFAYQRILCVA